MTKILKVFSDLLPTLGESELEELEKALLSKAKEKLTSEELDDYYTWVRSVWVNSRGEFLDFEEHKYLVDIYKDQAPNLVIQKCAQAGISERLISEAVWICDRLGKNSLYVFPTATTLSDFAQARLEPVFIASDYLSRITGVLSRDEKVEKHAEMGKKIQKVGLKQIGKGFLYLRGSQNQRQIITVDADAVYLDERDRFTQEHVPYIDKRTLHSTLKWRREASTPTIPGKGVNESYLKSDQRVWMLTCEYCGLEQELDFFFNVNFKRKRTICKECKKPINRLKKGRWIALNPKSDIHGYKVNGIHNPRRKVRELIEEYEKAQVTGFSGMQQFYNQVLGLPYEAEGKTLLISELNNCTQNYEVPHYVTGCFAGVDVGEEKHHMIISKKIEDKLRYVWIGTVSEFLGPMDSIEYLMTRFAVQVLVIDAKPETRKVKELIDKFYGKVFAAYYPTRKFDIQNYFLYDDFKSEVYIDRTISLDYLISDIQNELIELQSNAKYIKNFYEQMTAMTRQMVMNLRTGREEARWMERGPDHILHAANYNRIAMQRGTLGQALLDSYKEPKDRSLGPNSIAGWANLVRLKGVQISNG